MKGWINKIAYIGWRGIDYEEIVLDSGPFTGLIGPSGAGKSSLVMFLDYALLPDRQVLDVHPISELEDPQKAGVDPLISRISEKYGYAYVALDIASRHGKRLIAGIYVTNDNVKGELTRWFIQNPTEDMPLKDFFRITEGDKEYYPTFAELKSNLAKRGIDLKVCRTVGDYGKELHDAGILPTDLDDRTERALYGKLIETSFKGGISFEVASKLKDYLLPKVSRIPETISKLEECTNQMFYTRRAAEDADNHLLLLNATLGTGKAIVTNSLNSIQSKKTEVTLKYHELKEELVSKENTIKDITDELPRLKEEITVAKQTKEIVQAAKQTELQSLNDLKDQHYETYQTSKSEAAEAKTYFNNFKAGKKVWLDIAGQNQSKDFDWVERWLEEKIVGCVKESARKSIGIENLQSELDGLQNTSSNLLVDNLAKSIGGTSLEEAFEGVGDREAISLEMTLGGLTEGITGIGPDALLELSANDTFPALFWIGENLPSPKTVRELGDWYVCPASEGFVAYSKHKRPTFGRQARENRKKRLKEDIEKLSVQRKQVSDESESFGENKKTLLIKSEIIKHYLSSRGLDLEIERKADNLEKALKESENKYLETKQQIDVLNKEIYSKIEPYENEIIRLQNTFDNKERTLKGLNDAANKIKPELDKAIKEQAEYDSLLSESRGILDLHSDRLMTEAEAIDQLSNQDYLITQTRLIGELCATLKDETQGRLSVFQAAIADDPISCIHLWPALMGIVRDRIPADLVDMTGEDIIKAMRDRRSDLKEKLLRQEHDVKLAAKHICSAIQQEVRSQLKRISALSRFGESLQFGNVTGIRIKASTNSKMMSVLESFADKADQFLLFSQGSKPFDVILSEFFSTALNQRLDGMDFLDYRTYLDLSIEARRKGGDWDLATSLSGGESIGCGLAICLMLARSLASRGEIRYGEITPLFAIDEVHRLDEVGHKVIVDFAKREGFQVIVTAGKLEPTYSCTLYMMHRIYDSSNESLIIRAAKVKEEFEEQT